jgi:tetratricopeptide (TPR) repeat protein
MMDNLDYIDRFFNGELSTEESGRFEQRISEDPAFAEEVAFYASALKTAKDKLTGEKKKHFREIYEQEDHHAITPKAVRKLWPYIAAAAVVAGIILAGYLLFLRTPSSSAEQLADTYIKEQLQTAGVKMSGNPDSMQKAKNLYNEGKLAEALQYFEALLQSNTSSTEAMEFAGRASLRLNQYDKAITYFEQLENYPGLYANPGKFYHAVALMKRSRAGDVEIAKQLLNEVVKHNLDKSEIAGEWLKKRW